MLFLSKATSSVDILRAQESRKVPKPSLNPSRAVARSTGIVVHSFREVQNWAAQLGYYNPHLEVMFRGQSNDYQIQAVKSAAKESSLFPSIYRVFPRASTARTFNAARFESLKEELKASEDKLCDAINSGGTFRGSRSLIQHQEARWALFQHYKVCATPLIDVTRNTRVAATFAMGADRPVRSDAVIYAFGLPYLTEHITHNHSQNLRILNLRNLVAPMAARPHEQEGYLLGSLYSWDTAKHHDRAEIISDDHNTHGRLIGKMTIPKECVNDPKSFWGSGSGRIPPSMLTPADDSMLDWLISKGFRVNRTDL
jgi:hypothetical protein